MLAGPLFTPTDNRPPLVADLLDSILNFGKSEDQQTRPSKLAENGHKYFFDFNYPLAENINKNDFEILILNKFLMRRIRI